MATEEGAGIDPLHPPFPVRSEDLLPALRAPEDPCFGRFSASAKECRECLAPVIHEGRVVLVGDLCREERTGAAPVAMLAKNLNSRDVMARLARGMAPQDVLDEMAGPGAPPEVRRTAQAILARRLAYLASKGHPVPSLTP